MTGGPSTRQDGRHAHSSQLTAQAATPRSLPGTGVQAPRLVSVDILLLSKMLPCGGA